MEVEIHHIRKGNRICSVDIGKWNSLRGIYMYINGKTIGNFTKFNDKAMFNCFNYLCQNSSLVCD